MSGWEVERLVSRTKEVGCVPHPTKDDANGETGRLAAPNQGGAASRRAHPHMQLNAFFTTSPPGRYLTMMIIPASSPAVKSVVFPLYGVPLKKWNTPLARS